jgi:hypothetical protein
VNATFFKNRPFRKSPASRQELDLAVFEGLGRHSLAPILQSLVLWLHEQALRDGVTQLLFLARDGYMVQRAYQAVIPEAQQIPNQYMYASRRLFNLAAIRQLDEAAMHFLIGDNVMMPVGRYLERAGLDPNDCMAEIVAAGFGQGINSLVLGGDEPKLRKLFSLLEKSVLGQAEQERQRLRLYADSLADWQNQTCGVVDIGWHGSLQASLRNVLDIDEADLHGYYLGLHLGARRRNTQPMGAYLDESRRGDFWTYHNTIRRCVEIFELFFAHTDGSIIGLRRTTSGTFEPVREARRLPAEVRDCLVAAQEAAIDELHKHPKHWSRRAVIREMTRLLSRPSASEARCLGNIPHQEGFGGFGRLAQLARPRYTLRGYLVHLPELIWDIRKTFWRRAFIVRLLG